MFIMAERIQEGLMILSMLMPVKQGKSEIGTATGCLHAAWDSNGGCHQKDIANCFSADALMRSEHAQM